MEHFEALFRAAGQATDADQIIALRTAKGNTYILESHNVQEGDYRDEDTFLQSLALWEDTQVTHLVCCWNGGWLDVPSMHFRKGLVELNENNRLAGILLQGENRHLVKHLNVTLPK